MNTDLSNLFRIPEIEGLHAKEVEALETIGNVSDFLVAASQEATPNTVINLLLTPEQARHLGEGLQEILKIGLSHLDPLQKKEPP